MDPIGVRLTPDDLGAGDFPLPGVFGPPRVLTHGSAGIPEHPHADGGSSVPGDDSGAGFPETVEGDPDSADYLIGDWFSPMPHRPLHSTRCVAINRSNGQRCRAWAVIGFERCNKHSGYGKLANLAEYRERVLERARLDLLRAAPYAVERLVEIARDRDINPAVSAKAAAEILDRTGIKGGTDVEVTIKGDGEMSPTELIRARLDRLRASSSSASSSSAPELEGPSAGESEIVDAEVLDDDAAS